MFNMIYYRINLCVRNFVQFLESRSLDFFAWFLSSLTTRTRKRQDKLNLMYVVGVNSFLFGLEKGKRFYQNLEFPKLND